MPSLYKTQTQGLGGSKLPCRGQKAPLSALMSDSHMVGEPSILEAKGIPVKEGAWGSAIPPNIRGGLASFGQGRLNICDAFGRVAVPPIERSAGPS